MIAASGTLGLSCDCFAYTEQLALHPASDLMHLAADWRCDKETNELTKNDFNLAKQSMAPTAAHQSSNFIPFRIPTASASVSWHLYASLTFVSTCCIVFSQTYLKTHGSRNLRSSMHIIIVKLLGSGTVIDVAQRNLLEIVF